jgi:protein-S-isoprenylcysteine O-methyltransferase Ste14
MSNSKFLWKSIFGAIYSLAVFGVLLFVPAGTLKWPRGWWFMGVVFVANIATMLTIFRGHEDLLDERLKSPIQKGQPLADKILITALLAGFAVATAFIPLDIFRFHHLLGQPAPVVSALGFVLFVVGWSIMGLALRENAFAAPVVKHQAERHQAVIDSGMYRFVRHPMYFGGVLFMIGMPLWLGSYAAALLALVPALLLVVRIGIEERFLRRELKGYDAYTQKTPYRLIPHLW